MRKLMGVPFVTLFLLFLGVQLFTHSSTLAISLAVLAGLGLKGQKGWHVFLVCGLAMGLGWALLSFYLDMRNHSLLSTRMLQLFPLPNTYSLIFATSLLGALWGGSAGLAGLGLGRILSGQGKQNGR